MNREPATPQPPDTSAKPPKRRTTRRPRTRIADAVRYFVGRPTDGDTNPALKQEVASEPEALVIAFKNDSRVYLVSEYRVTQRIDGAQVRLEKESVSTPPRATPKVSTLNGS